MHDASDQRPTHRCLFDVAAAPPGNRHHDPSRRLGAATDLLDRGAARGRRQRQHRGLDRLRDCPSSPHEGDVAAWLALGKNRAVVSRVSAVDLLDLSDVIPDAVQPSVPRAQRYSGDPSGVVGHATTRPFGPMETVVREGIRLTSPARTIADFAEVGGRPQ